MTDKPPSPEPESPASPVVESATPTMRAAVAQVAASAERSAVASESTAQSAAVVAAQVPVVVQVLDKLSELGAACIIGALAWHRIIDGGLALAAITFIVTGNTGIRALSQRSGGPAVGIAGMAIIAGLAVSGYAPAVVAGPVVAAVVQRASSGRARGEVLALVGLITSVVILLAAFAVALTVLTR